ncbi:hypothetical protein pqer_cds_22 [Pandoravirus quercus]|uniref:Uncharacterized protein n=1 Tax=Pandoravirus quercus TaxID=2107709 RepID=A0A2U7U7P4_9VIRU|nr:hypothetical protein pqer_cds_22 [Pandoravirus quercus]AVK74444.1 hypothetical protein pqer_cds_22 [Pandoravirus quercus]
MPAATTMATTTTTAGTTATRRRWQKAGGGTSPQAPKEMRRSRSLHRVGAVVAANLHGLGVAYDVVADLFSPVVCKVVVDVVGECGSRKRGVVGVSFFCRRRGLPPSSW